MHTQKHTSTCILSKVNDNSMNTVMFMYTIHVKMNRINTCLCACANVHTTAYYFIFCFNISHTHACTHTHKINLLHSHDISDNYLMSLFFKFLSCSFFNCWRIIFLNWGLFKKYLEGWKVFCLLYTSRCV